MLVFVVYWLQNLGVHVPKVFTYFSTRMILSAMTCLFFTIILGPSFIKRLYSLKIGQKIRSSKECPLLAELHKKKKDTPTMGGVLLISSMLISLFLWMDFSNIFTWILLVTTLFLGALGIVDDYLKLKYKNSTGLKAKKKLGFQILFSLSIAIYLLLPCVQKSLQKTTHLKAPTSKEFLMKDTCLNAQQTYTRLYIPFYKKAIKLPFGFDYVVSFALIFLVIIGSSNAVNLTDGLDGLAAGCLIMVSLTLALFAFMSNHIQLSRYLHILYIEGSGEIAIYLLALAGACLGFLWYNGYPAQLFMGDTGSLCLGGILGVSAILIRREFLLAIAGGIFVIETLSVILQVMSYRYRNKKRIFLCAPLHHHFEYKGWPETKVVLRFWIVGLFFSLIAIASLKFQ